MLCKVLVAIAITIINYFLWFSVGRDHNSSLCNKRKFSAKDLDHCHTQNVRQNNFYFQTDSHRSTNTSMLYSQANGKCDLQLANQRPLLRPVKTEKLVAYKKHRLLSYRYPPWSILMQHPGRSCERIVNPHFTKKKACLAIVMANIDYTYNLLRYENETVTNASGDDASVTASLATDTFEEKELVHPSGIYNAVSTPKSRDKLSEKMSDFLEGLTELESYARQVLEDRGFFRGSSIVTMVVNAGEMDLFANFACSCKANNISMRNVMVFAGSAEIVPVIEAMGAVGIYHEATFAHVSKHASYQYLDEIFVDMMWYKAFSVWLLLKMRYNVLFQDVDLVWFRNPFQYFQQYESAMKAIFSKSRSHHHHITPTHGNLNADSAKSLVDTGRHTIYPDAYLSDDGQRGVRFTPFYANSGFYYLIASERTEYFSWLVLKGFDLIYVTGSHQNVFTFGLVESLDLGGLKPKLMSLRLFPSGIMYHEDRAFMRAVRDGFEKPYMFHM